MRSLFQQIRLHALAYPARPAVMLADRVITYGMVQSGINSVRHVLSEHRLEPDTCVAILMDNPGRHLIVALALMADGHAVASLRPELLQNAVSAGVTTVISEGRLPLMRGARAIFADENWFTRHDAPTRHLPASQPNRIIRIIFTSGSTGQPKPVAQSQRALMARLENAFMNGASKHNRVMTSYGMSGTGFSHALQTLTSGGTICYARPGEFIPVMQFCNVDELRGSVGQVRSIMQEHDAMSRPLRLKSVRASGAFLPPDLMDDIRSSFGCDVVTPYSSNEAGVIGYATGALLDMRRNRGNCYIAMCDIEIVSETDAVLPKGEEGLIRVRSPETCLPFTGALIESDGAEHTWLYTGDRGRIEPDELLVIAGRNDEVINVGGGKIDPEILESIIMTHPAVDDVATIRMTGKDGLDEVWAVVKVREHLALEALNEWFARRLVGEMRSVRIAHLEIVDHIPRTATSKIARDTLRKRMKRMG